MNTSGQLEISYMTNMGTASESLTSEDSPLLCVMAFDKLAEKTMAWIESRPR